MATANLKETVSKTKRQAPAKKVRQTGAPWFKIALIAVCILGLGAICFILSEEGVFSSSASAHGEIAVNGPQKPVAEQEFLLPKDAVAVDLDELAVAAKNALRFDETYSGKQVVVTGQFSFGYPDVGKLFKFDEKNSRITKNDVDSRPISLSTENYRLTCVFSDDRFRYQYSDEEIEGLQFTVIGTPERNGSSIRLVNCSPVTTASELHKQAAEHNQQANDAELKRLTEVEVLLRNPQTPYYDLCKKKYDQSFKTAGHTSFPVQITGSINEIHEDLSIELMFLGSGYIKSCRAQCTFLIKDSIDAENLEKQLRELKIGDTVTLHGICVMDNIAWKTRPVITECIFWN